MTHEESSLAWAAGFIDGEGCIHIERRERRRSPQHNLTLAVGNTCLAPLERLERLFGGSVRKHLTRPEYSQSWDWVISFSKAETALLSMLPFLVVKKERARLALDFMDLKRKTRPPNGQVVSDESIAQREAYKWAISGAR